MIRALSSFLVITLAVPTLEQSTPQSPCPNVFLYEPPGSESGRWYGVVNLSTDNTLHSLWLNVVLDSKADILGNWVGDVTTTDNMDFKIENTKMKIHPGPATAVRFFVQYNPLNTPPKLLAIRLNGREICNANQPQPAINRPEPDPIPNIPDTGSNRPNSRPDSSASRPSRPVETRPVERPVESENIRPEDRPQTRPVHGRPSGDGPVYKPTANPPIDQTDAKPYSIGDGRVPAQNVGTQTDTGSRPQSGTRPQTGTGPSTGTQTGSRPSGFGLTTAAPGRRTTKKPNRDDDFDDNEDSKPDSNDYFSGGLPTFIVPSKPGSGSGIIYDDRNRQQGECGTVVRNNPNPLVVNGKPTLEGQWPWQIALYQAQNVDSKYTCGGTLITRSHVITAAHCVTRKNSRRVVNKDTLTVYLGKHNLRTSVEGVQIRLVGGITVHPQYNATSFSRDLAILELREPVQYTDWVRPACLWPENEVDLNSVIGKKGSVVGWGFDDTGVATEELTLVEMPVVSQETCIRSYSDFFARFTSELTYCAGYRDGDGDSRTGTRKSTSVCNGDSGGGMVFNKSNRWYLRGLVSLSVARQNEYRCDPTHYVVFTDLAKFLPWIKQNINSN